MLKIVAGTWQTTFNSDNIDSAIKCNIKHYRNGSIIISIIKKI